MLVMTFVIGGITAWTRLVIAFVILPDLLVDAGVEQTRFGAQMRLKGHHEVVLVKLPDRILRLRVLEIPEDPGLRRANLHAGRLEALALRDAMVAKRALLRCLRHRAEEPAAVRAGLNAKAAANTIRGIDQHRPVRRGEGRAYRAYLDARRVLAEIAKLGHEERMLDLLLRHGRLRITVDAAVRTIDRKSTRLNSSHLGTSYA